MTNSHSTTPAWPGDSLPLGANWTGEGVNVAVYSEHAERIDLCLFDESGTETAVTLPAVTAFVHHGFFPTLRPGQRYGFRVYGPWSPEHGVRCNPAKLLVDPYAYAMEGELHWGPEVFGHVEDQPNVRNELDSAGAVPKSVVIDTDFGWGDDKLPNVPLHETVIYEAHVRGLTMTHPDVPEPLRGTYAGLATQPIIDHMLSLGITSIELLPVHYSVSEQHLYREDLVNYWGYNSIGYFAPQSRYAAATNPAEQVREFKSMVKTLHAAGIEVILDVVYNHTAEGNQNGPQLSLKGFDNPAYYRLNPEDPTRYLDFTGTGNSLNMRHSQTLQLMMDSLRYWIQEMHIDGFRFDLAAALARGLHEVDRLSSFFDLIHQDPVVNKVKLIAEPWDIGEGGYQVGNFPPLWSEWNGKYRDGVRDYWRGADQTLADFASRFTGSSDLYAWSSRRPSASINFITAHDGFTLNDLVSYDHKHNLANGEDNRDGESHNRSWNSGHEGPTDDPAVNETRKTRRRSLLTTLFLSQGVPMLLAGDEFGRTQGGNNNGYAQDNEVSWLDWDNADEELLAFVRRLARIRNDHPTFRRRRWFEGRPLRGDNVKDIGWYKPDGHFMEDHDWSVGYAKSLTVFMRGGPLPTVGPRGEEITDQSFLVLFNASPDPMTFRIPDGTGATHWIVQLDTSLDYERDVERQCHEQFEVRAWSVVLLRAPDGESLPAEPLPS